MCAWQWLLKVRILPNQEQKRHRPHSNIHAGNIISRIITKFSCKSFDCPDVPTTLTWHKFRAPLCQQWPTMSGNKTVRWTPQRLCHLSRETHNYGASFCLDHVRCPCLVCVCHISRVVLFFEELLCVGLVRTWRVGAFEERSAWDGLRSEGQKVTKAFVNLL